MSFNFYRWTGRNGERDMNGKIDQNAPERDASIDCELWAKNLPLKLYQLAKDKKKCLLVGCRAGPLREPQ